MTFLILAATDNSIANIVFFILLGLVVLFFSIMTNNVGNRKAFYLIEQWARSCDYTLEHCERRYFRKGPFFWGASKYQRVYYIQVKSKDGRERNGFIKVGSYWTGMMNSDDFELMWDDE
jgi:hypothetical protein